MTQTYKISVALAAYNGEHFLAEQLDSILNQTYPVYEIIISDDASNDSTVNIAKKYQQLHPRLKILKNKKNLGLNKNFENVIKETTGDIIAICDQDNIWKMNRLETMVAHIDKYTLIYSDSQLLVDGKKTLKKLSEIKKYRFTNGSSPKEFYFYNSIFGHNTIFKRILIKDILPLPDSELNYDGWISFVASCTGKIKYIDEALAYFRIHDKNLTNHISVKSSDKKKRNSKYNRREKYNNSLLKRLHIFKECKGINEKEKLFLNRFIKELTLLKSSYFRWPLFWIMIRNRKELLHYKKKMKAVTKSFSLAKGMRWFQLL